MEIIKNIAAILGGVLSAASVAALISVKAREIISAVIRKYSGSAEATVNTAEIKALLEQHLREDKEFKDGIAVMNEINIEFMKTQCRNTIKLIFYKYNDTKVIPLYEKKTLMTIEELYINKLHGNSFAALLLEEMSHWEVDYESGNLAENDV